MMPTRWHREDIKAAIRKRGITLERLAESNGLHKRACSMALLRPSFAAEMVIARFLDIPPQDLWPQRYDADGTYRHPKSFKYHTRRTHAGKRQKSDAA